MLKHLRKPAAALTLVALAACQGSGSGTTPPSLPPATTPNAGVTSQKYVGVGDSLTAGYQSSGLLGDPTATSTVSALPGGAVPVTQENGWWALFWEQANGKTIADVANPASGPLPLIKGPGLSGQLVVSTQVPGFASTHSSCDSFNATAFSPTQWSAVRMNAAAPIADLGVPGITMHEAIAMTGPLTGPPNTPSCGYVTLPGDPTSGGLQSLVEGESLMYYPILGQFAATLPPGTATELNAAVALKPQLTTVWLGANDLLKYIFSHGNSPATDSPAQFAADLTQIVTTLQKSGSKVVVGNLPHILGEPGIEGPTPQFFPIAKLSADLQALGVPAAVATNVQAYVQATYTGSGGFLTESGFFTVLSEIAAGAPSINLDPNGAGSGAGALYLDTAFATQVMALNNAYNTAIATVATNTGAGLADVETAFDQLDQAGLPLAPGVTLTMQFGGGLLSYDGLHPSNTAYAVVANVFIGAADTKFSMTIPPLSNAQIGTIASSDTYNPYVIKAVNPAWPYPLP